LCCCDGCVRLVRRLTNYQTALLTTICNCPGVRAHASTVRRRLMGRSPYDVIALLERAEQWRVEAAAAKLEEVRVFCLAEADQCEALVHRSQSIPVFYEGESHATVIFEN
jgi:hypothetical protein